jgi:hypothetical protein
MTGLNNPVTIYSPRPKGFSTIDLEKLNFRIRNGNGCSLFSKVTGKYKTIM